MKYYPLELFWSEEDEGYIARVPDLPGCNAWGATEMEAIEQVHDAIEAWQAACKQAGEPVPEPSTNHRKPHHDNQRYFRSYRTTR